MATKLKNAKFTSVDFVNAGANQDADIKFFKSDGGTQMKDEELKKSFFEMAKNFFLKNSNEPEEEIEKSRIEKAKKTISDENDLYTSTLKKSLESIMFDDGISSEEKLSMMNKSLIEFNETMADAVTNWSHLDKSITKTMIQKAYENQNRGGAEMAYKINKNALSGAEQAQLEELLEKAKCKKADDEEATDDEVIVTNAEVEEKMEDGVEKTTEENDIVNKAIDAEMANLRKNVAELQKRNDMKEMTEVAKKYTLLGKKEDELAETLYKMRNSNEDVYKQYVSLLDESLALVNKGNVFGEIGKSGQNYGHGGSTISKIEGIASEIQKSNADLTRVEAVSKAWEQHPELVAEYENEYRG